MDNLSHFESRTGKVTCNADDVFNFVTDIRNFEQFVSEGTISDWQADRESCSFNVSMVGTVSFGLSEKIRNSKVVYVGDALKMNKFSLFLEISGNDEHSAEVKIFLSADLNPVLKMMLSRHIEQFLEILINEMESFKDWKNINK